MILREYNDDEEVEQSDDDESDEAPDLIASRDDFEDMITNFLEDYEILGKKMQRRLSGENGPEKLDTIRRALGVDDRVKMATEYQDENEDILMPLDIDDKKDRWDCETILSLSFYFYFAPAYNQILATYSNLENHPRLIHASQGKFTPKIRLDRRSGFPVVIPAHESSATSEDDDDESSEIRPGKYYAGILFSINIGISTGNCDTITI